MNETLVVKQQEKTTTFFKVASQAGTRLAELMQMARCATGLSLTKEMGLIPGGIIKAVEDDDDVFLAPPYIGCLGLWSHLFQQR